MQDQTIRVFRLEDHFNVYTLHGHCGPITAAFVDHGSSGGGGGDTGSERDHCAGTGSQVRLKRSLVSSAPLPRQAREVGSHKTSS